MKGFILAEISGTRLYPNTLGINNQFLPVYAKLKIYYSLSTLMMIDIRGMLIKTTAEYQGSFRKLFVNGQQLKDQFKYMDHKTSNGLAQAFVLVASFIGNDKVELVLGDNIFYRTRLAKLLQKNTNTDDRVIFAYQMSDPNRYGVVEFDLVFAALSMEDKTQGTPKSNFAVIGQYFYNISVLEITKNLKPSSRDENKMIDFNLVYLKQKNLKVGALSRNTV